MHMSQPAVSTHVKNLEDYFQGPLFDRTSQGVKLTKAGEVFYTYAQKILDLHDEMEQQIETVFQRENNQVVIGASTTIGNVSLPCSIYLFKEEYPEVELCLNIANAEEVLRMVMADEVDIGVVEGDTESSSLKAFPVTSDELVLIVPPNHPAEGGVISLQDFHANSARRRIRHKKNSRHSAGPPWLFCERAERDYRDDDNFCY